MQLLLVLALVFASFVALFALQNSQTVPIRFFTWERETSIAVIALAAAAVGALSATLAGLMRQVAMGLRQRQLRGELARMKKSLEESQAALARLQGSREEQGAADTAEGGSAAAGPAAGPAADAAGRPAGGLAAGPQETRESPS